MYDYLIVGAGFAGSTLAERLASQTNKKVLHPVTTCYSITNVTMRQVNFMRL